MKKIDQDLVNLMFKTRNETSEYSYYSNDVKRIRDVLYDSYNVTISVTEAIDFWKWNSDNLCAGWLMISSDNQIITSFEKFINCINTSKVIQPVIEREWVKVIEKPNGQVIVEFDMDDEKESLIKNLYNVSKINKNVLLKLITDSLTTYAIYNGGTYKVKSKKTKTKILKTQKSKSSKRSPIV